MKQAIYAKWNAPKCQQLIRGWTNTTPENDDQLLKDLNLPSLVQLSVYIEDEPTVINRTINGVNDTRCVFNLSCQRAALRMLSKSHVVLISFLFSIPNDDGNYTLRIFDEVHSKEYKLSFPPSETVADVKRNMFHYSDIHVNKQVWSGWPPSFTKDDQTLGQLGLTVPVHELAFRSDEVTLSSSPEKKRNNKV